jgi:hypothetical protein
MSESNDKKNKQNLKKMFMPQIKKIAEEKVDEAIKQEFVKKDKMIWVISRQRDIVILIACGLFISNIVFIWLWVVK